MPSSLGYRNNHAVHWDSSDSVARGWRNICEGPPLPGPTRLAGCLEACLPCCSPAGGADKLARELSSSGSLGERARGNPDSLCLWCRRACFLGLDSDGPIVSLPALRCRDCAVWQLGAHIPIRLSKDLLEATRIAASRPSPELADTEMRGRVGGSLRRTTRCPVAFASCMDTLVAVGLIVSRYPELCQQLSAYGGADELGRACRNLDFIRSCYDSQGRCKVEPLRLEEPTLYGRVRAAVSALGGLFSSPDLGDGDGRDVPLRSHRVEGVQTDSQGDCLPTHPCGDTRSDRCDDGAGGDLAGLGTRGIPWLQDQNDVHPPHGAVRDDLLFDVADPVPAYTLDSGGYAKELAEVREAAEAAPDGSRFSLKVNPTKYVKSYKKEKWQLEEQDKRYQAALDMEETLSVSLAYAGKRPDGRAVLPFLKEWKMRVARDTKANQEYAIHIRHFPKPNPYSLTAEEESALASFSCFMGELIANQEASKLSSYSLNDLMPGGWSEKMKADAVRKADALRVNSKCGKTREFMIKINEILPKIKPRGIQYGDAPWTAAHALDATLFERGLFSLSCIEERSKKHADEAKMCSRIKAVASRNDVAASCDYGRFDSTYINRLRNIMETNAIRSFLIHSYGAGASGWLDGAYTDRIKEFLHLKSIHWDVRAVIFGRESGDRITSAGNYFANLCMNYLVNWQHWRAKDRCLSPQDYLKSLEDRSVVFDYFAEGDDLLLFTKSTGKYATTVAERKRALEIYSRAGFVLEPVGPRSLILEPDSAFLPVYARLEWCSSFFVRVDGDMNHDIVMVPKIDKTIAQACITFSQGPIADVGYTTALSGELRSAHCPVLREVFGAQKRFWMARGGKFVATNYQTRKLDWRVADLKAVGKTATPETLVSDRLATALIERCSDTVRKFIAGEYPQLTVELQWQIEQRCRLVLADSDADRDVLAGIVACLQTATGVAVIPKQPETQEGTPGHPPEDAKRPEECGEALPSQAAAAAATSPASDELGDDPARESESPPPRSGPPPGSPSLDDGGEPGSRSAGKADGLAEEGGSLKRRGRRGPRKQKGANTPRSGVG